MDFDVTRQPAEGVRQHTDFADAFSAKQQPEIINLRPSKYIIVEKKVSAESPEAWLAVQALYSLSEFLKTQSKNLG